ncbi:enoyl reductase [Babesia microti strain RI]|uniref:Enoyl reductase n=1 Tax=Babesia microti (strain RI) TaxID=1133968 RepID=I7IH66_BABMR|nr:enoyl reductase [Babesia microti strain RI]CCF75277.1 enoyl reductase [Babesia microti strain RI]|eukprot:XP_012649685.1 enoyl reductase [Babesia microti strain RI]
MKVILRCHNGVFIDRLDLPDDATGDTLRKIFYSKYHYYPERQKWTLNSANGTLLEDKPLSSLGVKDDSTLFFKDLGVQVSWRMVFCLEYMGPLLIFPCLYFFPSIFYPTTSVPKSPTQVTAFFMLILHFLKREIESLFIHRFSRSTMPLTNLITNCVHYWLFCGVGIGYYIFHPYYSPNPITSNKFCQTIIVGLFITFEFLNLMTHLTLRDLRTPGTKERNIPNGWGYQYVSCAHYLWEICCWITFSMLVQTISAYAFTILAAFIMSKWALKKHETYFKQFPSYPKSRKAIFPFIL